TRVVDVQPKAVALAAAAGVKLGILVDLEPTSLTVIIVRDHLVEVVRDATISPELGAAQVAEIFAGQVNRSVGYYNARYPDAPLPPETPIIVTGDGAVEPLVTDLALATLPYRRAALTDLYAAPDGFRAGQYAAALGAARQLARKRRPQKSGHLEPVFEFLPQQYRPRPLPMKTLIAGSAAAILLAGIVPSYQTYASASGRAESLQTTVDRLEPQVRLRNLQLKRIGLVRERLDAAKVELAGLVAADAAIKGRDREFAETLSAIRAAVPEGVALQQVDDDGSLVLVNVSSGSPDDLFTFVRALSAIEGFSGVWIGTLSLNGTSVTAEIHVSRGTR
ncbi:MAG: hypothetical protein HY682_12170, partial [Chloroflexi bacterium]|nr:hypothetical protein [Chloroflexota bacterium]